MAKIDGNKRMLVEWKEKMRDITDFVNAKGIQIGEDGVAFKMTWLFNVDMLRVGIHRVDFDFQFLGRVGEIDAIA
jgi:hypothetical protein